ncbi:DUF3530 domain-containing protein [Marinomonas piezotolerans]|uniref:DUF3530 domain-containing protein n=1 Tax=Marinomonas piezotolerans TaxID=2213058 RepID=A0A370U9I8_9GAMM|nr:DUF3530 family protein [Marinomonas piezotolerans]RDL44434.1 DUF3530 domain-containing protein [Marinomonas piezotolerans]
MKKLTLAIAISLYVSSCVIAAEGDDSTSTNSNTNNEERVSPTPQQTRIDGLIERISQSHPHQLETIEANGTSFLGLFEESTSGDPQGCVLILHNDHGHPDWPQVVSPLRYSLPEHSWCSLSIEVPDIIERGALATLNDNEENSEVEIQANLPNEEIVFARVDAALSRIREKGYNQVVYLGYRTGAAYALRYTAENNIVGQALVLIEPKTIAPVSQFQLSQEIRKLRLPVLDYYFDRTFQDHQFALWRQSAANKRTNRSKSYTQINALPDARYDPSGNKRLVQRVWGFLKQNTVQQGQRKELPTFDKELFYNSPLD